MAGKMRLRQARSLADELFSDIFAVIVSARTRRASKAVARSNPAGVMELRIASILAVLR
jgi:hypothetical protein